MALKILKQQAEAPVGSGNKAFPKGTWKFTILNPADYNRERCRPTPEFMHNAEETAAQNVKLPENKQKTPRIAAETGEILSIWLGNADAMLPGQDSAGDQKFFQDFVIKDGDIDIGSLDVDNPNGAGWQIQRDARLLANLAIALGATVEVTQGDKVYVELADNFVDLLKDGAFDGQQVVAEISHRAWESASGKKGIEASIIAFSAVE